MARALGEVPIDLAPDEQLIEQHVRSVGRMDGGLSGCSASSAFKTNGNGS
jgi:hypothetical protein